MRTILVLAALGLLLGPAPAAAEPVKVRLPEGNLRGFLVLRPPGGEPLAWGELRQRPTGGLVESQLLFHFKDGSVYDERATFSQRGVFRLEAYRLVQRGPTFPTTDVTFDRKSGHYQARWQEKRGDAEKTASGALDMPADLYNGMALVLLKNLGGAAATGQMAVFTPKPRLIKMGLAPEAESTVRVGDERKKVDRYLVKLEIGGLAGLVASLVGKEPPDLRYWLVGGDIPAFVRFEGAMFLNGPVWRVEFAPVEWPSGE